MKNISLEKEKIGHSIFEKVIEKKHTTKVSSKQICLELDITEEVLNDYFLGNTKENFPLGLKILNYLEEKEESLKI